MRAARQELLEEMARHDPLFPRTIYSSGTDRRPDGQRIDTITIVLSLDWPDDGKGNLTAKDLLESVAKTAVAATIFRIQEFLERHLLVEITLLDIRAGCVRIRFRLPAGTGPSDVESAIRALLDQRETFGVVSAVAHVGGRSVRL